MSPLEYKVQQDFMLCKAIGTHVTSQPSLSGKQVMASLVLQEAMAGSENELR